MKIVSIIGTRPNFIKMIPVINRLENSKCEHVIIHTGQHYDINMSSIFFREMNIVKPHYNLGVGSGTHGFQTGEILRKVEELLLKEEPDLVFVPGDTNSNLAGALAAAKLNIKVAHIEAGLRSFDKSMPEEINRILIDHCSKFLFCPTNIAVKNLQNEGINNGTFFVGDTMFELAFLAKENIKNEQINLDLPKDYILTTIHRVNNTVEKRLKIIMEELCSLEHDIVIPIHPRTKCKLVSLNIFDDIKKKITIIDPIGFLKFSKLILKSKAVITDSGGVQKEAYWYKKPCVTVRQNTEWIETIQKGGNILAEPNEISEKIELILQREIKFDENLYGFKDTSKRIFDIICDNIN